MFGLPGFHTSEGKFRGIGNKKKANITKAKLLKGEILYLTVCYSYNSNSNNYRNDNLNGNCRVVVGPKLTGPPRDPDYRGVTVYATRNECPVAGGVPCCSVCSSCSALV